MWRRFRDRLKKIKEKKKRKGKRKQRRIVNMKKESNKKERK